VELTLDPIPAALAVVAGFVALVWGADRFVVGSAATARNLGVSPLVIGLTLVGFGTSAPELLVSAMAASTGNPGLAIGNAIGSNITNVALVIGVTVLVRPLRVHSKILRRELPLLILAMVGAYLLMLDGVLSRFDGVALLVGFFLLMGWIVRQGLREGPESEDPLIAELAEEVPEGMPMSRALAWTGVGLVVLLVSSRMLVAGAASLAAHFGVSDMVVGLTVVALGTSLPELAASVTAALKNEHDIAVGNVVGSNIFNLLGVLGLPGVIAPGPFDQAAVWRDFPAMIGVTVLLFIMARGFGVKGRLTRWQGALLVALFIAYDTFVYT
jgi:cation:H+ antiporter